MTCVYYSSPDDFNINIKDIITFKSTNSIIVDNNCVNVCYDIVDIDYKFLDMNIVNIVNKHFPQIEFSREKSLYSYNMSYHTFINFISIKINNILNSQTIKRKTNIMTISKFINNCYDHVNSQFEHSDEYFKFNNECFNFIDYDILYFQNEHFSKISDQNQCQNVKFDVYQTYSIVTCKSFQDPIIMLYFIIFNSGEIIKLIKSNELQLNNNLIDYCCFLLNNDYY